MYKITIQTLSGTEKTLYFPGNEEYTVTSAVLSLKVGSAGEFNFTVPLDNPRYNEIVDHSIVTVYEDNVEIWRGDIQDIKQNFDKSLNVYCLEDMAWLGECAVEMTAITNQTYGQRFSAAIATYNADQVAKRQFTAGMLTSITTTNMCTWQPQYEENLLSCLRNYIADDGYVRIRREYNGGTLTRYVDIVKLSDYGQQADQKIEFGSNLLDFVKEMDNTNFINVIYPYGKETETPLYGEIMQRIVGTPIQNDVSIAAFGRRERSVIFETDSLARLNSLAQSYLNRYSQPSLKIKSKAIDLGNIEEISRMHLGDSVRIIAEPFAIDQWDYITNQELDLLNIANNQIELSDAVRVSTLTSQVATQGEEIKDTRTPASVLDEAKRNAWSIIEGDNGGIVTFDVNGNEQIIGIHIANNLDLDQATKAWGWNVNGLVYLHRTYPSDEWQIGIAMTMNGEIVADYITTGEMSADRINGGHIRANLITALNGTTEVGNNTLADFATKASTIVDVDVEYAKNQSSTTAPTSGWSTSSPQWEEGYYIWQRTKTTDGNGQASYSTPVCIQGAKGQDGTAIASVTVTYGTSSSPNTQPSSWQTTIPTVADGDYLWIRTVTDYTDSSVQDTVTYTYSRQGEDGQQGQAGTSVTVSSIQYQEGTSATSAPTGTWSNNPVTVAQGNYLWTKTTFSNGSIAYGVARQGENGTDGTDGSDGVGVSAIVEQYYLSTSDQSPTGGSWSTNQPAWVEGKYIWTRSHVTWTDSTTSDTAPVLAKAINGANQAVKDLDDDLDQDEIFNRLTNNDQNQGIFLDAQTGKIYINATYIKGGIIEVGGSNYQQNASFRVKDTSDNVVGTWSKDGFTANKGNFGKLNIDSSDSSIYAKASAIIFTTDSLYSYTNWLISHWVMFKNVNKHVYSSFKIKTVFTGTVLSGKSYPDGTVGGTAKLRRAPISDPGNYTDIETIQLRFNQETVSTTTITTSDMDSYYYQISFNSDNVGLYLSEAVRTIRTSEEKNVLITDEGITAPLKGIFNGDINVWEWFESEKEFHTDGYVNWSDFSELFGWFDNYYSYKGFCLGSGEETVDKASQLAWLPDKGLAILRTDFDETTDSGYIASDLLNDKDPTKYKGDNSSVSSPYNYYSIQKPKAFSAYYSRYSQRFSRLEYNRLRIIHNLNGGDDYTYTSLTYSNLVKYTSGEQSGVITWDTGSDERLKKNIKALDVDLSKNLIDATEPKEFEYKNSEGKHYGMIAQEARKLLDSLGETDAALEHEWGVEDDDENDNDYRTLDYIEYIPHVINYIKDLRSEIVSLKEEVRLLKEEKNDGKH